MSAADDLAKYLQSLAATPQTGQVSFIQGVVTAISAGPPPTLSMTLSGDTQVFTGFRYLQSYTPTVGDVVTVVKQNNSLLVVGCIASGTDPLLLQDWRAPSLFGGVTSSGGGGGPVKYRVILQNGQIKTQLKGSVSISGGASGSPFGLFTLNNLAAPDSAIRTGLVITDVGLCYIQYDWTDNVANLMGGTGAVAVLLDGHEFFPTM